MTQKYQICPICSTPVTPSERYPDYVCNSCASKASSPDGRLLAFFNTHISGGYLARYKDTDEEYPSHDCFIDGITCRADEAYFGGIVIRVVQSKSNSTGQ